MTIETFGDFIREARLKRNIPLRVVADTTGIDTSILSKIERGERSASAEMVPRIAKALQIQEKQLKTKYLTEKVLKDLEGEEVSQLVLASVTRLLKEKKTSLIRK